VLLHPNGFCAGLFDPLARRLSERGRFRPIGVDLRGHGGSASPRNTQAFTFPTMAADVVAILDHLGVEQAVVLGESLGGGVGVLVDEQRPGLVRKLMLCEAIAMAVHPQPERPIERAAMARRRTDVWPDRATMRAVYATRPPLSELAPEALDAYLTYGTVDLPDGRVQLACRPEDEATVFDLAGTGGPASAWDHLGALHCDVAVLAGDSSFLPLELFEAQAARASTPLHVVPGGHFFLQADTERAVKLVEQHLA
jgi:pimeloyl-ACP methyl ester carboxylesterase